MFIQGKHVFLERMREILKLKPLEKFKTLNMPFTIMCGAKDRFGSLSYIGKIEQTLSGLEPQQFSILYYRNLDHFFKEAVKEKSGTIRYRLDPNVPKAIRDWLDSKCVVKTTQ